MNSVHHIAFYCRDRVAQEAFYAKHLGFERVRTFAKGEPNEFAMLRLGNTCIEMFPAPYAQEDAAGGPQPVGFSHLAFEVDDLDGVIAGLNADGIETDPIADCSDVTPGMRICFFTDPEGNRVELMHGYKDE